MQTGNEKVIEDMSNALRNQIADEFKSGMSFKSLAKRWGVGKDTINGVVREVMVEREQQDV